MTFLALFVGRTFNVYLMAGIGYLIQGKEKFRLNIYELPILFVSGMVHGAVPFALIITIPLTKNVSSYTTQANVILVILLSSLIFNSLIPKFEKIMLKRIS